ncbi:hypothetical protein V6N13_058751 [Hibiscus sabdariffa]
MENRAVSKLFDKVGQKLQYYVDQATYRRPDLWAPPTKLLGAACGVELVQLLRTSPPAGHEVARSSVATPTWLRKQLLAV